MEPGTGRDGPLGEVDGTEFGLPGEERLRFILALPGVRKIYHGGRLY